MTRFVIIAIFSGVVAWFAARLGGLPAQPAVPGTNLIPVVESKPDTKTLRSPAEFGEWARNAAKEPPGKLFAGWSDGDLKAALEEGVTKPFFGTNQEALHALVGEWTRRDPDAAWQWLLALRSESTRIQLSLSLADAWPPERGAEGLEMALAHPEIFAFGRLQTSFPLIQKTLEFAARSGPDAVEAALVKITAGKLQIRWASFQFPAGFDFDALSRKPEMLRLLEKSSAPFATEAWMKADPEGAFLRLLEINRQANSALGNILTSMVITPGDNEEVCGRAQWMGKRLEGLEAEDQRQISAAFARRLYLRPVALREFLLAMPEGEARDQAAVAAARRANPEGVSSSIAFLDAVADPAGRIEALRGLLAMKEMRWGYDLSAAELEKMLGQKLAAWNADTEQTAEILRMAKEAGK